MSRRTAGIRREDLNRRSPRDQGEVLPREQVSVLPSGLLLSRFLEKQYNRLWARTSGEPIEKQLRLMKTIVRPGSKGA